MQQKQTGPSKYFIFLWIPRGQSVTAKQSYKRIGMSIHLKQHPFMKEGTQKGPRKKVACDQKGHATQSGNPKRRVYISKVASLFPSGMISRQPTMECGEAMPKLSSGISSLKLSQFFYPPSE
jgi:hypothetical protein